MQPTAPGAGIAAFGHHLLVELSTRRPRANLVVSPATIATCFAMLRPGARGRAAAEIDAALHFPDDEVGPVYARLAAGWAGRQLAVANGVWLQEGLPVREAYLRGVEADFGAAVRRVDFGSPGALAEVNAWVREQTHGLIDRLLATMPDRTGALLGNAVHLRASWQRRFDPLDTADLPFHLADGTQVPVRAMSAVATFELAVADWWRSVRLPYADCDLALWVLVPEPGTDPVTLLDPVVLARARSLARAQRVELRLPTWCSRSDLDLESPLRSLGMRSPFDQDADFSALSPDLRQISKVVHRAVIAVDEQGTVAAAATGVTVRTVSMPAPGIPMAVDRPFAYALVHEPTGAPIFSGVVRDPRP